MSEHMGRTRPCSSGSFDCQTLGSSIAREAPHLEESRDSVQSLHVGPTYIIVGSVDGHVRTYDLRKGELRSDFIRGPVASVIPTKGHQSYLVATLDSGIRLGDKSARTKQRVENSSTSYKHNPFWSILHTSIALYLNFEDGKGREASSRG